MTIKAVLFDMDGTVVDSERMHTKVIQDLVREEFGIELTEKEVLKYIGLSYKKKLKELLEKREVEADLDKLNDIAVKKSIKPSNLVGKMHGAEEIIQEMKKNFKVGLVTGSSKEQAESLLKSTDLKKYFDVIVSSSEVEKNKPYPDSYLLAAKKLNIKPEECVVIEDSSTGVEAAKKAGMFCIVVRNECNKNQDFSEADVIVKSLENIDLDMIISLE